ncbi:MAG: hypothetical protein COB42_06800 [Sulfurimonas sp.]|nr:MAG: hypothetical protein COB42_06800 [Sulfurimonas sp.]
MKLHELKKGDRFKFKSSASNVSGMTGKFLGKFFVIDEPYGKVRFDDIDYTDTTTFNICHATEEVEVLK